MGRLRLLWIAMSALALTSCAITTISSSTSTVTKDAHKVAELDVVYFAQERLRVQIQRYDSLSFSRSRLSNGSLTVGVGKITTAFGKEFVGTFEAAARTSEVLHRLSVSNSVPATVKAINDALPGLRFTRDDALVISPISADVTCGDHRCGFAILFHAILYDAKAKRVMWYGDQRINVVRTLNLNDTEMFEFDAVEAVESYWNEIFSTLRSDRLLDKSVKIKLRADATPPKANPS